jgi:hypothetical protein
VSRIDKRHIDRLLISIVYAATSSDHEAGLGTSPVSIYVLAQFVPRQRAQNLRSLFA